MEVASLPMRSPSFQIFTIEGSASGRAACRMREGVHGTSTDEATGISTERPVVSAVDPPHRCDLWDEVGYLLIDPAALLRGSTEAEGRIARLP